MSTRQTQEQERAAQAWKDVRDDVKEKGFASEYKTLAVSAPADIQINGLGQTLAFWLSKGKEEHTTIYGHLSSWVTQRMGASGDLLQWITQTDSTRYRQATVEALAFLGWLRRFSLTTPMCLWNVLTIANRPRKIRTDSCDFSQMESCWTRCNGCRTCSPISK